MAVTPEQMKEIVKQLEDEFDYVIIDSAPAASIAKAINDVA